MRIKEIRIKNFKRFDDLTIRGIENAKLVILVGTNGSGKLSLFEACNFWHKQKYSYIFEDIYHLKNQGNGYLVEVDFNKEDKNVDVKK